MKFTPSKPLTLGVELELQLIDPESGQLVDRAADVVPRVEGLCAEITQAMVEYNSPVCESAQKLQGVLLEARANIVNGAADVGLAVCGGGLHPFHRWPERQISGGERFDYIRERYAYLAQMFTVFGQHIHVGCRNGQEALYLTHALSRYIPHFIALSASSPFHRGVDTQFACARLNVLSAFPTSGTAPWVLYWKDFERYLARLQQLDIAQSVKDLYWDVRPKPDIGTVEIRVCDTPLTAETAGDIAAYAQLVSCDLLATRQALREDIYLPYRSNRFQACRFGLHGMCMDPFTGSPGSIRTGILNTLERLWPLAQELGSTESISRLGMRTENCTNGATTLRQLAAEGATLPHIVSAQAALWSGEVSEMHELPSAHPR